MRSDLGMMREMADAVDRDRGHDKSLLTRMLREAADDLREGEATLLRQREALEQYASESNWGNGAKNWRGNERGWEPARAALSDKPGEHIAWTDPETGEVHKRRQDPPEG